MTQSDEFEESYFFRVLISFSIIVKNIAYSPWKININRGRFFSTPDGLHIKGKNEALNEFIIY